MKVYISPELKKQKGYNTLHRIATITKTIAGSDLAIVTFVQSQQRIPAKEIIIFCSYEQLPAAESTGKICCVYLQEAQVYLQALSHGSRNTYLFSGYSCCRIGLHAKLKGWTRFDATRPPRQVDYLHIDPMETGYKDVKLYNLKCRVKNTLRPEGLDLVCDKSQLYKNLSNHLPQTWDLKDFNLTDNYVYITKPAGIGAYKGRGISIVTSESELEAAKKQIYVNHNWKGIISHYIDPPLLFQDRKFHIRVYMIVTSANTYSVFSRSHILTAAKSYKEGDYSKVITDTHGGSTDKDWEFPFDYSTYLKEFHSESEVNERMESMIQDINTICNSVWSVLDGNLEKYAESDYGFELIALDIMFDATYGAWLLEVNRKVGLTPNQDMNERYSNWCLAFFEWMYNSGISKGFL